MNRPAATRRDSADVNPLFSRAVAVFTGVAAAVLLALAVPRLFADFTLLASARTLNGIQSLRPIETADLGRLIRNQRRALVWRPSGRTWTDLGLAQLLIAERLPREDPKWREQFEAANRALIEGLSLVPANPFAWSRLAYAEAILSGWSPPATAALRMAFITSPHEPRLIWPRLRLSFSAWPNIPLEDQDLVLQQVRQAWVVGPDALAAVAVQLDKADVVRAALGGNPADLREFERLLASRKP